MRYAFQDDKLSEEGVQEDVPTDSSFLAIASYEKYHPIVFYREKQV